MRLFHALALPAGAALLIVAPYLAKRRRRALADGDRADGRARAVRPAQGPRLRGDDPHLGAAAAADPGRDGFRVRHDPITLRSAIWRVPLLGADRTRRRRARGVGLAGHPSSSTVADARPATCCAGSAGRCTSTPLASTIIRLDPAGVHLVELGTLLAIAYVIFRPLAAPRTPAEPGRAPGRRRARPRPRRRHALVLQAPRRTSTTSSATTGGRSSATRIENGVLLLSGDPVGPRGRVRRPARAAPRVRRRPRPEARRGRGERAAVPAVRGARAADDLPRRRGDGRARVASRSKAARSARSASRSPA